VREQDLEIHITGNRLTVTGRREEEEVREGERYFAAERSYGTFTRSFLLPDTADLDGVRAELRDGVLKITVPKRAGMQGRRVPIGARQAVQELEQPKGEEGARGEQEVRERPAKAA
jgi:HSP20 family protein